MKKRLNYQFNFAVIIILELNNFGFVTNRFVGILGTPRNEFGLKSPTLVHPLRNRLIPVIGSHTLTCLAPIKATNIQEKITQE